ncbi:hypothetical protein BASA81_015067 [Batrachochytrium salamandrivorans]|nr:hypothetical protein BASA81_015067 [Batrachochytrium salamandrivorans]
MDQVVVLSDDDDGGDNDQGREGTVERTAKRPLPNLALVKDIPPDLVKLLLSRDDLPKLSTEASKAMGEVILVFIQEAVLRSKNDAESGDDRMGNVEAKHLVRILPKLLLDF